MIKNEMTFPLAVDTQYVKATTNVLYSATDEELKAYTIGYIPWTMVQESVIFKGMQRGNFSNVGANFAYEVVNSFRPERGLPICYSYSDNVTDASLNAYNNGTEYINTTWGSTTTAGLLYSFNTDYFVNSAPTQIASTNSIALTFRFWVVYLPDGSEGGQSPSSGSNGWVKPLINKTVQADVLTLDFSVTSGTDSSYMPTEVTFTKEDLENAGANGIMKKTNGTTTYAGVTYNITVHCAIIYAGLSYNTATNLKNGIVQSDNLRLSEISSSGEPLFYNFDTQTPTRNGIFTANAIDAVNIEAGTYYYMGLSDIEYEYFRYPIIPFNNDFVSGGCTLTDLKILRSITRPIHKINNSFYVAEFNDDYTITGELIPYANAREWQKNINGDTNTFDFNNIPESGSSGISFKKFNGSTWDVIQYKTYNTITEALDRTENLYDPSDAPVTMYPNQSTGTVEAPSDTITYSVIIQVEPNTEYTASFDTPSSGIRRRIGMYSQLPSVGLSAEAVDNTAAEISGRSYNTFTTTANTAYILFMFYSKAASSGGSEDEAKQIAKTITIRKGTSHVFVPYGFKLQSSGEPLTDYTIYGNTGGVGDKTANLFNGTVEQGSFSVATDGGEYYTTTRVRTSGTVVSEAGMYTISAAGVDQVVIYVYDLNGNFKLAESDVSWGACPESMSFNADRIVRFVFRYPDDSDITPSDVWNIMFCKSEEALPYEPYGYKIPVTSGGVTTNLYTDSPLDAGDTLTYTDTSIAIPTVDGDNIITFNTTIQPLGMDATYKSWRAESLPKIYDTMEENLERTPNLVDPKTIKKKLLTKDGIIQDNGNYRLTDFIKNESGLCININTIISNAGQVRIGIYDQNKTFVKRNLYTKDALPIILSSNEAKYIRVNWSIASYDTDSIMVNEGGVMLPSEPYGFKIQASGEELTNYTICGNDGDLLSNCLENRIISQEINGLTITVNGDDIKINGLATATTSLLLYSGEISTSIYRKDYQMIDNGIYEIDGNPSDAATNKYTLSYRYGTDPGNVPTTLVRVSAGQPDVIDNTNGSHRYMAVYIGIWNGVQVDNVTFSPTLRRKEQVGTKTKNLFDKDSATITHLYPVVASQSLATGSNTTYSVILPCEPNTTYTVSRKILSDTRRNRVGGTSAYPENGMQCTFIDDQTETVGNEWTWNTFTTDANTHYIVCWIITEATEDQLTEALKTLMIEKNDDRTDYEPYGYKIPVISGGATTNLYLEAPLSAGDTLTYMDTGIALPTFDGNNTISFDTTVQPSGMSATFKGWHLVQ